MSRPRWNNFSMIASAISEACPPTSWRSVLPTCFIFPSARSQKLSRMPAGNSNAARSNLATLRKEGWKGVNLKLHFDAVTQVEKVAKKCLKPDDWLLDHIQEELAFMRGADLRR